jgi:hypothetical protein
VADSTITTPAKRNKNRVKGYPQLDCVELERYIFPVLHVTLGITDRLLKHTIDYADLVVERTPEVLQTNVFWLSWYLGTQPSRTAIM